MYNEDMYFVKQSWRSSNGKIYFSVMLRESYRENGKVKKRTIANLKKCSKEEVDAIELALKHKTNLTQLQVEKNINIKTGKSFGAVWALYCLTKNLGIEKALGTSFEGKLALWQIIARVLEQGSRLSAVRLANVQAIEILDLQKSFTEDDLYKNLFWLSQEQENIENKLFNERYKKTPAVFLYDVTSSYLEGTENELADYGYNRDGKRSKKQIVMGLLCDPEGVPLSTKLFKGNTSDILTFSSQIKKIKERFGCQSVTLVGDRGMIKINQIKDLNKVHFHYITAITKAQIKTLLSNGEIQMEIFDNKVHEVCLDNVRYICRRNPKRAEEMMESRKTKKESILKLIQIKNEYLKEHKRASSAVAITIIQKKINKLKINSWLSVNAQDRMLVLKEDFHVLREESKLDGCYVLKTDLSSESANKEIVHERYKDLTLVERAFRSCKTTNLELRPIYVRTEETTRGHAFVVMLSYLILRKLQEKWSSENLTVSEGLDQLKMISTLEISTKEKVSYWKIPIPNDQSKKLLDLLNIKLPKILPKRTTKVDTRKKLQNERK
jgi:transposase